jgi:diaminohydroxyphosphoribosylaminopyrimidine deaminase/5-amino-6-(5-phosphoribosylamino)uracil reductase
MIYDIEGTQMIMIVMISTDHNHQSNLRSPFAFRTSYIVHRKSYIVYFYPLTIHEPYMQRCLQLARLGMERTAPNPMVGSVLVYEGQIIGEGFHEFYGGPHAEVNCLASVKEEHHSLIPLSTLYVSLEPCAHFGKTPPCADLIIRHQIKEVVIGCRDPFVAVNGKGIEKLQQAGINCITGILEKECKQLNRRFFTYHTLHRPFITLKWAQTLDGKIGLEDLSRLQISNQYTSRLVHRLRASEMAILVGTNTALFDDPELTTRLWPGSHPLRLVLDLNLRLPSRLKLFQQGPPVIVFNLHKHTLPLERTGVAAIKGLHYYQVTNDVSLVPQILNGLYRLGIQSLIVEGGARLLQSFIDEESWDEAMVITNTRQQEEQGLPAPELSSQVLNNTTILLTDVIRHYQHRAIISE